MADETIIYFGEGIKALGDGRIGGYLVRFSDENSTDLDGDFFTKSTDFGTAKKTPVWFHHRQPLPTKDGGFIWIKEQIGDGEIEIDDEGVFVSAVLYNRSRYEQIIDKLGWSSGTAQHLVERKAVGNAHMITHWPLGLDASLTPTPAEPRNKAVNIKSLADAAPALAELSTVQTVDIDESKTQPEPEAGEPEDARSASAPAAKAADDDSIDDNAFEAQRLALEIEILEMEYEL